MIEPVHYPAEPLLLIRGEATESVEHHDALLDFIKSEIMEFHRANQTSDGKCKEK